MLNHLIIGRAALGTGGVDLEKAARVNCGIHDFVAHLVKRKRSPGTVTSAEAVAPSPEVSKPQSLARTPHLESDGRPLRGNVVDLHVARDIQRSNIANPRD